MLGQPLVGACLAGALLNPGPQWELWVLRIPLGVGALLQLLLTEPSLPAAQRPRDAATAGVVGASTAILALERLHPSVPVSTGGLLWVVLGTVAGLVSATIGGWMELGLRSRNLEGARRMESLAQEGRIGRMESTFWGGIARIMLRGASWSVAASVGGLAAASLVLPRAAHYLTGPRTGLLFAVLLGVALAAGYRTHVRASRRGLWWAGLGALTCFILLLRLGGSVP